MSVDNDECSGSTLIGTTTKIVAEVRDSIRKEHR
jgi:hypothetical protein